MIVDFRDDEIPRGGGRVGGVAHVRQSAPRAAQRRIVRADEHGGIAQPRGIVSARADARRAVDRDRRARVGEHAAGRAAADGTRIGAVERVADRPARRPGERDLRAGGDITLDDGSGHRPDPLRVEKVRALLQVVLEPLHLSSLARRDGVAGRKRARPTALRVAPPRHIACRGFIGDSRGEGVDERIDRRGGEFSPAQLLPAVDVFLVKVDVEKEAVPPCEVEEVRAQIARLRAPRRGVRVASIHRGKRSVEIPDRPRGHLAAAFFIPITAEAQCIDVEGPHVQQVMIDRGGHVEVGGVAGHRVVPCRALQRGVHVVDVIGEVLLLRRALRGEELDFLGIVIGHRLPAGDEAGVAGVAAIHFPKPAAGLADGVVVIHAELVDVDPVLVAPDFLHEIVNAEVIAGAGRRPTERARVRVEEHLDLTGVGCVAADRSAHRIHERVVEVGAVEIERAAEHIVRAIGHAEDRHLPVVVVARLAGLDVHVVLGITQRARAAAVDDRAHGQRRQIGEARAIVRHGGLPDPHKGTLIPGVRRRARAEVRHRENRHRRTEPRGRAIEQQEAVRLRLAGKQPGFENPRANLLRRADQERRRVKRRGRRRQRAVGRVADHRRGVRRGLRKRDHDRAGERLARLVEQQIPRDTRAGVIVPVAGRSIRVKADLRRRDRGIRLIAAKGDVGGLRRIARDLREHGVARIEQLQRPAARGQQEIRVQRRRRDRAVFRRRPHDQALIGRDRHDRESPRRRPVRELQPAQRHARRRARIPYLDPRLMGDVLIHDVGDIRREELGDAHVLRRGGGQHERNAEQRDEGKGNTHWGNAARWRGCAGASRDGKGSLAQKNARRTLRSL